MRLPIGDDLTEGGAIPVIIELANTIQARLCVEWYLFTHNLQNKTPSLLFFFGAKQHFVCQ